MPDNYKFSYSRKGKFVFVPTDECAERGERLIQFCRSEIDFPPNFFHYRAGGHVAALHNHIQSRFFFRINIQNFFYSVSRNRIGAALHALGFKKARSYAKWSCVKNPVAGPAYALPIGFVQSPVLASIALLRSPVADALRRASEAGVFISVYFDDFIGSGDDPAALATAYSDLINALDLANFTPSPIKLAPPDERIIAFNCELRYSFTEVLPTRIAEFFASPRSGASTGAFEQYCRQVAAANP